MSLIIGNKRGFTLMELLIVIVILGVLAGVAVPVYSNMVEKAREQEAYTFLGHIRQLNMSYFQENGKFGFLFNLRDSGLLTEPIAQGAPNPEFYFNYSCPSADENGFSCNAVRSRNPISRNPVTLANAYYLTIDQTGTITRTEGTP